MSSLTLWVQVIQPSNNEYLSKTLRLTRQFEWIWELIVYNNTEKIWHADFCLSHEFSPGDTKCYISRSRLFLEFKGRSRTAGTGRLGDVSFLR